MNNLPIGVFDSGVGGLTVLHQLQRALPNESFIYFGDTARLPYGTKSAATVTHYAIHAGNLLHDQGVKCLVVACNTASSVSLEPLKQHFPDIPVIGVLEPGASAAVAASTNQHIAVVATESTVKTGAYQKTILQLNPNAQVISQSCSVFVALAEEGWLDDDIAKAVAHRYLIPIFENSLKPDCILLGCTHFPALLPAISSVVNGHCHIIDSGQATAVALEKLLTERELKTDENSGSVRFLVSDSPERFSRVARRFLNDDIDPSQVEWIDGVTKTSS